MNRVLCLGQGYVASYLKKALEPDEVIGTTQDGREGTFVFNASSNLPLTLLEEMTHILVSIPPINGSDLVIDTYKEKLSTFKNLKWIGYLSSTSVYGNHQGAWVTEESETNPTTSQGKERLYAEKQWQGLADQGLPVTIFRLAGIYGPHRSVVEDLKKGKFQCPYLEGHVFSRIHIADIIQVLLHSMKNPKRGAVFNVADDLPASRLDVMTYGAQLLGLPSPVAIPFEEANLSPQAKAFYQDFKRVSNKKIKAWLGKPWLYPTYREGLKSFI